MANQVKGYSRQAPRDRDLRASNADRDAVAEILRRQHSEGRLDTDEFAERYSRCLEARTYAELDQLIVDLPEDEPAFAASSPAGTWAASAWQPTPHRWAWPLWRAPVLAWLGLAAVLFVLTDGRFLLIFLPLSFFLLPPMVWRSFRRRPGGSAGPWGCQSGYRGPVL